MYTTISSQSLEREIS